MRDHISMLLKRKDQSFSDVTKVLIEYRENIGDPVLRQEKEEARNEAGKEGEEPEEGEEEEDEAEEQRSILAALIDYLQSLDD